MTKPILFLDVDGVLNPWPLLQLPSPPEGYAVHTLFPEGWQNGLRVLLNPTHGRYLLKMADVVELVWATSWNGDANAMIGPLIGLPELPVVHLPRPYRSPFGQIWKRELVDEYANGRPFAWFDDQFEDADLVWAKNRTATLAPTRLYRTDPNVGLKLLDFAKVDVWAQNVHALGETEAA